METPYLMREIITNPKDPNRRVPNAEYPIVTLGKVNVELFKIPLDDNWEASLNNLAKVYGMNHRDEVHISRLNLGSQFDLKMKMFFQEHLHEDAEVRFIREGSGYFDVRSEKDEWIRIPVRAGDFLYLPPGIYHRFTVDHQEHAVAIRFFKECPRWEAINRSVRADDMDIRKRYLRESGLSTPPPLPQTQCDR